MTTPRRLACLTAVAAVAAAALVLTAPIAASAATNGELYAISWEDGIVGHVNPLTGAFTPIGGPNDFAVAGFDVDPTTGLAYGVTYNDDCDLVAVDLTTGVITVIAPIVFAGVTAVDCTALDINDAGTAWVAYDVDGNSNLGSVDLTTGAFTPLALDVPRLAGLATDPTDGILYAIDYDDAVYAVDQTTGNGISIGTLSDEIYAGDFGRDGTLWGTDFDNLVSAAFPDLTLTIVGSLTPDGSEFDFGGEALTVYYAAPTEVTPAEVVPQLAVTGVDSSGLIAGAGTLLALGLGTLVVRARRHTRAA